MISGTLRKHSVCQGEGDPGLLVLFGDTNSSIFSPRCSFQAHVQRKMRLKECLAFDQVRRQRERQMDHGAEP